jgi:hypothetical protein
MAKLKFVDTSFRPLLSTVILLFGSALLEAKAQRSGSDNSSPLIPGIGKEAPTMIGPEAEIYHRAAIKREVEAHREMLERAQENTRLGAELLAAVGKGAQPNGLDLKKLDQMEKLARKIRGGAGGSQDDEMLQNPPRELVAAVQTLAEASEHLLKDVEKTSRLVTSATVIKRSNEVIQLVRHVKSIIRR